ncbi:resolvase [Halobacteriales archaeon QH_6_64_20]|nr:MAG: resolvase [Halobacteriales archaeon QH_6_64_20]
MNESTVVYTRVASEDRSTAEQRGRALEYAAEALGLDEEDVRVLSDRGTEARADDSSGYQRLSSLVAADEVTRVIVTDAARIARNIQDLSEIVGRLVEGGVAVHVIDDGLRVGEDDDVTDSAEPDDETVLWALAVAADLNESIGAERTKEGIDAAKASGKHVTRGYQPCNGTERRRSDRSVPRIRREPARVSCVEFCLSRDAGTSTGTIESDQDRPELPGRNRHGAMRTTPNETPLPWPE